LIIKNYREGQDAHKYLILDYDTLAILNSRQPEDKKIKCYPIGAVPKPGHSTESKVRQINDFSYPIGNSLNDCLDRDALFPVRFQGPKDIMATADSFEQEPGLLYGATLDVAGAYRNNPIRASSTRLQGVTIREYEHPIWSIDLYSPFGNASSGYDYGIPGQIIHDIHNSSSPQWRKASVDPYSSFTSTTWADDSALLEHDVDARLGESMACQYLAMTRVLGPSAIAEDKDSGWFKEGSILGLWFDFDNSQLSMKPDKIAKAWNRVTEVEQRDRLSRSMGDKLLGSLRYLSLVIRPAKAFFQRLHKFVISIRRGIVQRIPIEVLEDLTWMKLVLLCGKLNNVKFADILDLTSPDVMCVMDASGEGSCAVDVTNQRAFVHAHSDEDAQLFAQVAGNSEDALGINVMEMSSALHAALLWAPAWHKANKVTHVHFCLDNVSAVAWINKRYSPNERGQNIVRLLTLVEILFNLRFSASYIPGEENILADAGSRLSDPDKYILFKELTNDIQVIQLPNTIASVSTMWHSFFKDMRGVKAPAVNMSSTGNNGLLGAPLWVTAPHYQEYQARIMNNWPNSPHKHGILDFLRLINKTQSQQSPINWQPSGLSTSKPTSPYALSHHSTFSSVESSDYHNQSPHDCLSTQQCSEASPLKPIGLSAHPAVYGESQFSRTSFSSDDRKCHLLGPNSTGLSYNEGIFNFGMIGKKNASQKPRQSYPSYYEAPKTINTGEEKGAFCTSQETQPFVQCSQQDCYVRNTTQGMEKKTAQLQKQQDQGFQPTWCQKKLKMRPEHLGGMKQDIHSIHYESEEHQHYSTQRLTRMKSRSLEDGNRIVMNGTSNLKQAVPNHYQEVCSHPQPGYLIDGVHPTHRPSRSHGGDVNNTKFEPQSIIQKWRFSGDKVMENKFSGCVLSLDLKTRESMSTSHSMYYSSYGSSQF
jgi:hypothetical protein